MKCGSLQSAYCNNRKIEYSLTASHVEFGSLALLFLRHDLRYVRILFLALSANSGNCLVHESIMAWIFSLGCLLIGTIRSRFSSTNSLTNICNKKNVVRYWCIEKGRNKEREKEWKTTLSFKCCYLRWMLWAVLDHESVCLFYRHFHHRHRPHLPCCHLN